jgi:hypothetical protein
MDGKGFAVAGAAMVHAVDVRGRSVPNASIGFLAGLDFLGKGKQNDPSLRIVILYAIQRSSFSQRSMPSTSSAEYTLTHCGS